MFSVTHIVFHDGTNLGRGKGSMCLKRPEVSQELDKTDETFDEFNSNLVYYNTNMHYSFKTSKLNSNHI